jgi:hypothetical protein
MSYGTNPFALGGWNNPGNPASINSNENRIYSNLPINALQEFQPFNGQQMTGPRPSFSTYRFVHPAAPYIPTAPVDTLNSIVVDAYNQPRFLISTAAQGYGNPAIGGPQPASMLTSMTSSNPQVGQISLVEWFRHPVAQLANVFQRQLISTILQVRSASTVVLSVGRRSYQWVRNPGDQQMYFFDASFNPPELMAIASREAAGTVMLNVSPTAPLEVIVFSSALLLSGRTLD